MYREGKATAFRRDDVLYVGGCYTGDEKRGLFTRVREYLERPEKPFNTTADANHDLNIGRQAEGGRFAYAVCNDVAHVYRNESYRVHEFYGFALNQEHPDPTQHDIPKGTRCPLEGCDGKDLVPRSESDVAIVEQAGQRTPRRGDA